MGRGGRLEAGRVWREGGVNKGKGGWKQEGYGGREVAGKKGVGGGRERGRDKSYSCT